MNAEPKTMATSCISGEISAVPAAYLSCSASNTSLYSSMESMTLSPHPSRRTPSGFQRFVAHSLPVTSAIRQRR